MNDHIPPIQLLFFALFSLVLGFLLYRWSLEDHENSRALRAWILMITAGVCLGGTLGLTLVAFLKWHILHCPL